MRKPATNIRLAFALRLVLLLLLCAGSVTAETPKLNIKLVHDSPLEHRAQEQLLRLAAQYDLKKYTLTRDINIEQGAVAHSSPVLTMNARFLPRPDAGPEQQQTAEDLMLSQYIHEQAHWVLMERHRRDLRDLYGDLKHLFPNLPTAVPEGDGTEQGSYIHIVVIALEWSGTEELVGTERARKVIDWKKDDHYKAIYRAVIDNREKVDAIMKRYGIKW
jgi:hypothetical protein